MASAQSDSGFGKPATAFFNQYCADCHGAETQEAGLSLQDLESDFESDAASALWLKILRQIEIAEMPPDGANQPSHEERMRFAAAIRTQFELVGKPVDWLRAAPKFGNDVNHRELFSGKNKGPAYSRPRIWRISPYIDGPSSPFGLSQSEGFKDFAHMWSMDKPTLELLLVNTSAFVKNQIGPSVEALKIQDEVWKEQIFGKRRSLRSDVERQLKLVADNPENAGHKKRLDSLQNQLERNEKIDFEKDRKRPSNRLAGLKKNVFWRIAYSDSMPTQNDFEDAVTRQLRTALRREPSKHDIASMAKRLRESIRSFGNETGTQMTMTSILMSPEAIYRMELGLGKKLPDGRRMLNAAEIAYALGYALTDGGPDKEILNDLAAGKLENPSVIKSHVERIYDNAIIGIAKRRGKAERVLRFFKEYFAYGTATDVFKDGTRHPGHNPRPSDLIKDTDLLILHILKQDKDVLKELLTTDIAFIRHVPTRPGWETISSYNVTKKQVRQNHIVSGEKNRNNQRYVMKLTGQRAGILTQPSWLTAHSTNFDNDPVKRGKWIYEHLLGGTIPDLPITVDAVVPEDPDKSLRARFAKTHDAYCMKCHIKMNPLGMSFEMFDDVGRYRKKELLRDNKTLVPVDSRGGISQSGVPGLDGSVNNAIELMDKLATSSHVRQVFVRHVFRYWMGRNETLDDSPTLMAADKAFTESGGSMKTLLATLLSSDSFLYRKSFERKDFERKSDAKIE